MFYSEPLGKSRTDCSPNSTLSPPTFTQIRFVFSLLPKMHVPLQILLCKSSDAITFSFSSTPRSPCTKQSPVEIEIWFSNSKAFSSEKSPTLSPYIPWLYISVPLNLTVFTILNPEMQEFDNYHDYENCTYVLFRAVGHALFYLKELFKFWR